MEASSDPRLPEVLAPAGDWDCARAAVENGADAIYFGVGRFNARVRANNFTVEELPRLMAYLHGRGVRGYAACNTLIFTDELPEAEALLRALIAAGTDAAIVQDVGIARLLRRISPDFPIHASTQMSLTSRAGLEFARDLGASLAVLARECPLEELVRMRAEAGGQHPLDVEIFVHGALCVAYSGQCLTSESLGGRSANRGECAQACRLPYELLCDGQPVPLGDRQYLLSPQDLASVELVPDMIRAGVASLKIEGRLKSPEYVANVTRVYREAVDRVAAALAAGSGPEGAQGAAREVRQAREYELQMAFSRGLFTGWLEGIDNQRLVHARFGTKRGVFLGTIERVDPPHVWLRAESPVKPGDGVVFDAGRPDTGEEGGRLHAVEDDAGRTRLRFAREDLRWARLAPGQLLWKTSDPELDRHLRQTFTGDRPRHTRPLDLTVRGRAGEPLRLTATLPGQDPVELLSGPPLEPARQRPLDETVLREQLGRLGGTPFHLGALANGLEGAVMLPVSELNRLRREAVRLVLEKRSAGPRWTVLAGPTWQPEEYTALPRPAAGPAELIPLVRSLPQLEAALAWGAATVYVELENPKQYREAVRLTRAERLGGARPPEVWVAPPRIHKTGEEWILRLVRSSEADGYLVRNVDQMHHFADCRRRGDFSLNVANPPAARYFLERHGLERLTASYDLNIRQLEGLLRTAPPGWFEITLHQHMPMFHMEHCVFCAFLTSGRDYRDCGRPCDRHELRLRDRVGSAHVVKADAGCRNTVFNARAQTGADFAAHLLDLGARHFRVEFLDETPARVTETLHQYARLLRGEIAGSQLWRDLKLWNQLGVTRGTLAGGG